MSSNLFFRLFSPQLSSSPTFSDIFINLEHKFSSKNRDLVLFFPRHQVCLKTILNININIFASGDTLIVFYTEIYIFIFRMSGKIEKKQVPDELNILSDVNFWIIYTTLIFEMKLLLIRIFEIFQTEKRKWKIHLI